MIISRQDIAVPQAASEEGQAVQWRSWLNGEGYDQSDQNLTAKAFLEAFTNHKFYSQLNNINEPNSIDLISKSSTNTATATRK